MAAEEYHIKKVLCFGELLIRMSPKINGEWITENQMASYIGGAELNVATALARWEVPTKYFTALPENSLTEDILDYLKNKSIDTSGIRISGNRIGLYFLPQGSDLKNAGVIYDRAYSSFSEIKPGDINWDDILSDVFWLHFTAISPALNAMQPEVCLELLREAAQRKIYISVDLNYRSKLWKYGKMPVEVMPELVQYCDMVMGNIWAAHHLLGMPLVPELIDKNNKASYLEHAILSSEAIVKNFPKVKVVANTFRFDISDTGLNYYATLYDTKKLHVSNEINAGRIIDKIGSGDCFMAGLIYGTFNNFEPEKIINFCTTAAVGKMYETSDATDQSAQVVLNTANYFA